MVRKKKSAEESAEFIDSLKEWLKLEDETIKHANSTMKKTKNKLVWMTMEMIKHDSEKHKAMQKMLID
ncbi:MAG TPA: hypothetical protein VMU21_02190, partial [Thermodesulfovibrionales bacterium]|nr:hypothetical protein [Thermodesulfovibrionales bacterium]